MALPVRLAACAAVALAACAAALPAAAQTSSAAAASMKTTLEGAYTKAQAREGETVFQQTCGNCHPTSQFTGSAFQRTWHGQPVFALFDQVRMMMPMDNPGGLSATQYAAVIAYILELNEYPAGEKRLPESDSALKLIRFESRTAKD